MLILVPVTLLLVICAAWVVLSVVVAAGFALLKTGERRIAAERDAMRTKARPASRGALAA